MIFQGFCVIIRENLIGDQIKMKVSKKLETDYQTYLDEFDLQATREEYRTFLRKSNPLAMKKGLENYLRNFFFETEVSVSETGLHVQVVDRGEVELGVITTHFLDIPMLYSVSTQEAVKLLAHIWYSFKGGFDLARMTGYWEFPELVEGSAILQQDNSFAPIFSACLRTNIDEVFVANKGSGKQVYLEKVKNLHEVTTSREYLWCSPYAEFPHTTWVSSLEVLPYTPESTINTQVCIRPFIEVEVVQSA